MKPMFSNFILAIKFDCLFWAIFQSFHLFVSFIFDKLPPPLSIICFKRCLKSLKSIPVQKNSLRSAKNVVFSLFCILVDRPMGRGCYTSPGYATAPCCSACLSSCHRTALDANYWIIHTLFIAITIL